MEVSSYLVGQIMPVFIPALGRHCVLALLAITFSVAALESRWQPV